MLSQSHSTDDAALAATELCHDGEIDHTLRNVSAMPTKSQEIFADVLLGKTTTSISHTLTAELKEVATKYAGLLRKIQQPEGCQDLIEFWCWPDGRSGCVRENGRILGGWAAYNPRLQAGSYMGANQGRFTVRAQQDANLADLVSMSIPALKKEFEEVCGEKQLNKVIHV
jgi:hypothetical protein